MHTTKFKLIKTNKNPFLACITYNLQRKSKTHLAETECAQNVHNDWKNNKPFSCSASSCCRAWAASMRTGISRSLDRMFLMTSRAVLRLPMFLNLTSAKLLSTQQA